jgi:hypothetical protein
MARISDYRKRLSIFRPRAWAARTDAAAIQAEGSDRRLWGAIRQESRVVARHTLAIVYRNINLI